MNDIEIAEALEKAADLYESEEIDWCQLKNYKVRDGNLSACAQGAIYLAVGAHQILQRYFGDRAELFAQSADEEDWRNRILKGDMVIGALAKSLYGEGEADVPFFNDTQGRTKQEVIDAMKNCAKDLRNG